MGRIDDTKGSLSKNKCQDGMGANAKDTAECEK